MPSSMEANKVNRCTNVFIHVATIVFSSAKRIYMTIAMVMKRVYMQ